MRSPSPKFLLFNAAAALAGVAAVLAAAWSVLMPTPAAPCNERYHAMTTFGLERGGVALTAADLQASVGGKDVGVIDSVTIGPVKGCPCTARHGREPAEGRPSPPLGVATQFSGGTSFPWQPRAPAGQDQRVSELSRASAGRLRVSPRRGAAGHCWRRRQGAGRQVRRAGWRGGSKEGGGVTVRVTENGVSQGMPVEPRRSSSPRGRWAKVEQEVVLNTPKMQRRYFARVGQRRAGCRSPRHCLSRQARGDDCRCSRRRVPRQQDPRDAQAAANKDAKVWLTPFEARWQ